MPRAGLSRHRVAVTAADLADEVGLARLSVADVAKRLGVSAPAIYKHTPNLEALHRDIGVLALGELTQQMSAATAGHAGKDALQRLAAAYRAYGHAHPARLEASTRAPAADDVEHIAASDTAVALLAAALSAYKIPDARLIDGLRIVRASLHGFVALELGGAFGLPADINRTFALHVDALDAALRRVSKLPP